MKRKKMLFVVETKDGILIEARRTVKAARNAGARARRRGVKNRIQRYVEV